jgi:outer membrane beta-barrel protein
MKKTSLLIFPLVTLASLVSNAAMADNSQQQPQPAQNLQTGTSPDDANATAERVNVESIKERYWARGDANELGVVQNRTYSKDKKFEFGLYGGFVTTDPFLNVKNVGGQFGYHFSEYISAHLLYWHDYPTSSSALVTFQQTEGATANTNPPRNYYGGEIEGSILYGKLSLVGQKIIYYDMHLIGGVGMMNTDNGNFVTPNVGIGQQIYINKNLALRIDYRLMAYHEAIYEKVITPELGQLDGYRWNWTNAITIGFDILFGPGAKQNLSRDASKGGAP